MIANRGAGQQERPAGMRIWRRCNRLPIPPGSNPWTRLWPKWATVQN